MAIAAVDALLLVATAEAPVVVETGKVENIAALLVTSTAVQHADCVATLATVVAIDASCGALDNHIRRIHCSHTARTRVRGHSHACTHVGKATACRQTCCGFHLTDLR